MLIDWLHARAVGVFAMPKTFSFSTGANVATDPWLGGKTPQTHLGCDASIRNPKPKMFTTSTMLERICIQTYMHVLAGHVISERVMDTSLFLRDLCICRRGCNAVYNESDNAVDVQARMERQAMFL